MKIELDAQGVRDYISRRPEMFSKFIDEKDWSDRDLYSNRIYKCNYDELDEEQLERMNLYLYKLSNEVYAPFSCEELEYSGMLVSTKGRVKTVDGKYVNPIAAYTNGRQSAKDEADHYWVIRYRFPDNQKHTFYIHRMVCITHVPNVFNLPYINHIDGNKQNNDIRNLEWTSQRDNISHRYIINGESDLSTGENSHFNKYSREQIKNVCEYLMKYPVMSYGWISEKTGVSEALIPYIRQKKIWKSLTGPYEFPERPDYCFTSDQSYREYELLKQGMRVKDVTTVIMDEFGISDRRRLYDQITAMRTHWKNKGLL